MFDLKGEIPTACLNCGEPSRSALACLSCEHLFEAAVAADHFSRFGLSPDQAFDRDTVEHRYLQLSRLLHPDRQAGASPEIQARAVSLSALLNESWRVLTDEQLRAEYLVELSDPGALDRTKQLDPAFLMEAMELSEELEDARSRGCTDTVQRIRAEAADAIRQRMDRVSGACATTIRRIADAAGPDPGEPAPPVGDGAGDRADHAWDTAALATLLHQARVYRRILRDTEKA